MATYQEWKIRQMREVREAVIACAARERSALVFKASQKTVESDPSATPDCAGADTSFPNGTR